MSEERKDLQKFYYKNNRLQQVRGFINIVKYEGVTMAAKSMGLTQSAVSSQIAALEKDLGVKLFRKSGRKLALTQEGQLFYDMSIPLLHGIDSLCEKFLSQKDSLAAKEIVIAGHQATFQTILPKYVRKLTQDDPSIKVTMNHYSREDGVDMVLRQEADMAFYPLEKEANTPKGLDSIEAFRYKPVCIFPKGHAFERKKDNEITFEDIQKEQNFLHTGKYNITATQRYMTSIGCLNSQVDINDGSWVTVKAFVAAGCGISAMDETFASGSDDISFRRVYNLIPRVNYKIFLKSGEYRKSQVSQLLDLMSDDFDPW